MDKRLDCQLNKAIAKIIRGVEKFKLIREAGSMCVQIDLATNGLLSCKTEVSDFNREWKAGDATNAN